MQGAKCRPINNCTHLTSLHGRPQEYCQLRPGNKMQDVIKLLDSVIFTIA